MNTVAAIVSWNCRDPLARCLAALRLARCPAVVADNASTDGTPEMVHRDFPDAEFREMPGQIPIDVSYFFQGSRGRARLPSAPFSVQKCVGPPGGRSLPHNA